MENRSGVAEEARLASLAALGIMGTAPEPAYDEAVQLAAAICDVPISLMTLIDEKRQWFKARIGMDLKETPREQAFCHYAIRQDGLFIVPDALLDSRFRENPLVTQGPRMRFYAGMPFSGPQGLPLGSLCVIDVVPRELTPEQRSALAILARQVTSQIALRSQMIQLNQAMAEKERLQQEATSSTAVFQAFMDNGPMISFMKDMQGRLVYYNRPFADRFKIGREDWLGKNDFEIWPLDHATRVRAMDVEVLERGELQVTEESSPGPDSSIIHWRTYKFPFANASGQSLLAGMSLDITPEKLAELALQDANSKLVVANARLHALAVTDVLTGLANRRAFDERLAEQLVLAHRYGTPLSMLLLDVDHFKLLNDTYGHDEGDAVLRHIAAQLQSRSRGSDLVSRYGGEEFAVLLPNTTLAKAMVMGDRMRQLIQAEQLSRHTITVSAGASTHVPLNETLRAPSCGGDCQPPLTLPRMADLALYQAKSLGKNRVVCYEPGFAMAPVTR